MRLTYVFKHVLYMSFEKLRFMHGTRNVSVTIQWNASINILQPMH